MPTITAKDGAQIFYKDWGQGQPVVFSHGWPLNADAWDDQLYFFATNGYRAIAHDRRGHGRSTQSLYGNDMDTYADDLAALVNQLDLTDVIHVGHSTGGGEVARYIGRHGTRRVAKAILVDAVMPGLLKAAKNPDGIPIEEFDKVRAGVRADRSQFWKDFGVPFYGANRPGSTVSQGILDAFWMLSMQAGFPAAYECDFPEHVQTMFSDKAVVYVLRRAARIGPAMEAYVRRVLEPHAKINLRKPQGLVDLADRYDRDDLEATAARALSERRYQLSDFKRLLQSPVAVGEAIPISAETAAFIRSPGYFIH